MKKSIVIVILLCLSVGLIIINLPKENDKKEKFEQNKQTQESNIKKDDNIKTPEKQVETTNNESEQNTNKEPIKDNDLTQQEINKENIIKENISKNTLNNKKSIILVDKSSGSCAQAIEYFYEDTNYKYYFNCIKSPSMYVIVDGKEYKLVEALKTKIVTIEDLENNGYKFQKVSKNLQVK